MTQGFSEHNTPATCEGTPVDVPTPSLFAIIDNATADVAAMLRMITSSSGGVSIGSEFAAELQLGANGSLVEMAGAVVSAKNQAVASLARNVKG
jgi:Family of unknown function (DUF5407)